MQENDNYQIEMITWNRIIIRKEYLKPYNKTVGLIANVLNCDVVVSEFELQSRYYVHIRINTLGKSINPLIPY